MAAAAEEEDQLWMLLSPYEALWDLQEPALDPTFVYTLRARYANPLSLSYWDIKHVVTAKTMMSFSCGSCCRPLTSTFQTPVSQSNFSSAITH